MTNFRNATGNVPKLVSDFKKVTLVVMPEVLASGETVVRVHPTLVFGPGIGMASADSPEIWRFLDGRLIKTRDATNWSYRLY